VSCPVISLFLISLCSACCTEGRSISPCLHNSRTGRIPRGASPYPRLHLATARAACRNASVGQLCDVASVTGRLWLSAIGAYTPLALMHAPRCAAASAVSAQAAGRRRRVPARGRARAPAPGGPGGPCAPILALGHAAPRAGSRSRRTCTCARSGTAGAYFGAEPNEAPARRRPVAEEVYLRAFWHCYWRLEDQADEMVGKAAYFRFLTLLGARQPRSRPELP